MVFIYRRRRTPYMKRRRRFRLARRRKYSLSRRTTVRRRLFGGIPRLAFSRSAGFPEQLNVHLRYNRISNATAAAGAVSVAAVAVYNPNSLSVVDPAAGSHQPMFHDALAGIYERYCVNWFKVTVIVTDNVVNTETTGLAPAAINNNAIRLILQKDIQGGTYSTNANVMTELGKHPDLKWRYINGTTQNRFPSLSIIGRPHVMFQRPKNDDTLSSAFGTSPSALCYVNILIANANDTTASITCYFNVIIDMYATCFDVLENQALN